MLKLGLGGRRSSAHRVEFRGTVSASLFSFCHRSKYSPLFFLPSKISEPLGRSLSRSALRFRVLPLSDGRYSQLVWVPSAVHLEHGRPPSQRNFCLLHDEQARAVRGLSDSDRGLAGAPIRTEAILFDLGDRDGPAAWDGETI